MPPNSVLPSSSFWFRQTRLFTNRSRRVAALPAEIRLLCFPEPDMDSLSSDFALQRLPSLVVRTQNPENPLLAQSERILPNNLRSRLPGAIFHIIPKASAPS